MGKTTNKLEDDMIKLLKEICAAEEEFRGNGNRTYIAMRYFANKARHIIAEIESPDTPPNHSYQ